ncbi:MAG: ABC transporter ATP-binding protein [Nitrospirota bacterium]
MDSDITVSVANVSKKYRLYSSPKHRLREALNPFGKKYHRDFWALRNISFDVRRGEVLGIIGKNGSGKSTLLQIICGVLNPTSGEIATHGRLTALLGLGVGFNPQFTGRNNVYLNGALMGFSREEIDVKMQAIEKFADIGEFIDQPMKTYSSGMFMRLAFACSIMVRPDILVVDEALSVGDVFFQQKCFAAIRDIISKGTTCLFVSHDTTAILNLCNRALLLNSGEIDFQGEPEEAVSRYYSKMGRKASGSQKILVGSNEGSPALDKLMPVSEILKNNILLHSNKRNGAGGLKIVAACITDSYGNFTSQVRMMNGLSFHLLLHANEEISNPSTGIALYDRLGNLIFSAGNQQLRYTLPSLQKKEDLTVRFDLTFRVRPGQYTFELIAGEPSFDEPNIGFTHDKYMMLGPIRVTYESAETLPFYGFAQLPMKFYARKV